MRRHKWFLVRPALPLIGSCALLFLLLGVVGPRQPASQGAWAVPEIVAGILVLLTGVNFLYKDLVVWYYETAIITNKRIIQWGTRGSIFNPSRQETPLDKVVQVAVDQHRLWAILMDYGTVHVYLVGGEILLQKVPRPKRVKELVGGMHETLQTKRPPQEEVPRPHDPALSNLLAGLARPDEIPKLPDADERYTSRHPEWYQHRVRGPRRTFGGPLRISCDVRYTSDEFTVAYIQRSRYVLAGRLVLPILALLACLIVSFLHPSSIPVTSVLALVLLLVGVLVVINYVDDVYILTNKRIIDIQRKLIIFAEDHIEIEYKNIRDIRVRVPNVIEYAQNVGDVYVETPGTNPDIIFNGVDHPFALQDKIYFIKDFKDKTDKIRSKNERKQELLQWVGIMTSALEKKSEHRGVPDLYMLDFYTAAQRASASGMKVVIMGEDDSRPHFPSGVVVAQNPIPGTWVDDSVVDAYGNMKPPEIQVILSRQPH